MASCCCLLSPGVAREGRGLSDRARTLRASDSPNSGFLPTLIRAGGRLPSRFLKLEASLQLTGFEGTPKTQSCLDLGTVPGHLFPGSFGGTGCTAIQGLSLVHPIYSPRLGPETDNYFVPHNTVCPTQGTRSCCSKHRGSGQGGSCEGKAVSHDSCQLTRVALGSQDPVTRGRSDSSPSLGPFSGCFGKGNETKSPNCRVFFKTHPRNTWKRGSPTGHPEFHWAGLLIGKVPPYAFCCVSLSGVGPKGKPSGNQVQAFCLGKP